MSDYLNKNEVDQLMDLFNKIKLDLSDDSFPTRTNRLEAVENMAKVLEIHGWKALRDPLIWEEPSKTEKAEGKESFVVADARDQHLINRNFNKATGGK